MEKNKYATGKRKTSIAKVWLSKGSGKISVNGKDFKDYFKRWSWKMKLKLKLKDEFSAEKWGWSWNIKLKLKLKYEIEVDILSFLSS